MSDNQEGYDRVMEVLHKIHKHLCCYTDIKNNAAGKAPDFCDCKFGGQGIGSPFGEYTGCPEMREVIHIMEALGAEASSRLTGHPKFVTKQVPRDWCEKMAKSEEGCEVGAGASGRKCSHCYGTGSHEGRMGYMNPICMYCLGSGVSCAE